MDEQLRRDLGRQTVWLHRRLAELERVAEDARRQAADALALARELVGGRRP